MSAAESLVIEQVAIDLLKPDPANARNISRSELDALTRSIREFGFVQPVLVRRLDAVVIGGHQRLLGKAKREPLTKPGDVWLLGHHRVLCGDATKAEDVGRVLAGARSAMAFTDPPYNVDLGNHGGQAPGARRRPMANDALDPVAWEAFVRPWARNLLTFTDGSLYICMSSKEWPTMSRVLAEEGGHWSDTIIYSKDRFVLGRADYQRGYEPLWYGWRAGASHFWCGDRDQSDVWQIPRPAQAPLGPVMKPLELVERAIENSSRPGDLVLDVFLGSGTTLIAAERTGRVCAAIELDPHYVDVAVARWEAFTGAVAVKAEPVVQIGGAE